jgi:hypothetical protein
LKSHRAARQTYPSSSSPTCASPSRMQNPFFTFYYPC